jgi:hypothetical protein
MSERSEQPREIIARCHAERSTRWAELGSGEIADDIISELENAGFVIVPQPTALPNEEQT